MSFLNTIKGLGRSSKKNKKDLEPTNSSLYSHSNLSGNNLRRTQSPTKNSSPTKYNNSSPIRSNQNTINSKTPQNIPTIRSSHTTHQGSPTKRNRGLNHHQQQHRSPQKVNTNKNIQIETPLFLCDPYVKTALVKGSYKTIVQLPAFVDLNEWLALNIFEFFGNLDSFYSLISEFVKPDLFPTMNAGPTTNYLWVDGSGQAINLPACQYIDYVITWISNKINDQENFPTKNGAIFPQFFIKDIKNISRQMFRIFAFIYFNQFDKIIHLNLEAHFNSFFAHFISFIKEFNLLDKKELDPLQPLIDSFEAQGKIN
ncbi:MOB2 [Candida pseudojiufengensis]|uniref:MOB2 n=1 Tax=Candida pseudojiufengensis TaxID=497109 RepID=UPI00222548CB|nr:MOB2 [Candida pseudojiufengensis]KAI5966493.1 MOB2 [Candida pseudojiufengensis]